MSNSLLLHGLQHASLPCPSPTPRAYLNSCPLSRWCHSTISSSVIPFSFCLQSFPASGSFPMSQFFASGDQSIGVSASASVLPMHIQEWFLLGWADWNFLAVQGTLKSLLQNHSSKASILRHSAFFIVQLSHPYMTTGKKQEGSTMLSAVWRHNEKVAICRPSGVLTRTWSYWPCHLGLQPCERLEKNVVSATQSVVFLA